MEAAESPSTECPVCGASVAMVQGMVNGELFTCNDCGTELEVLDLKPFSVGEAPQEEEDWGQ